MQHDPHQLHNIYPLFPSPHAPPVTKTAILNVPISKVVSRLDALLLVLKSCRGQVCVKPWDALHPEGGVKDLRQALRPTYDAFYEKQQPKVGFERCEPGYILDAEGPQHAFAYRRGSQWSAWS